MIAFAIVTSLEPLAHIDKLPPQRRQGSENTYVFMWKFSPRLRSGYHEPGDEFGIDPGKRERLDLCRRQLDCDTPCIDEFRPDHPFMGPRSLKSHFHGAGWLLDHRGQRSMAEYFRKHWPDQPRIRNISIRNIAAQNNQFPFKASRMHG